MLQVIEEIDSEHDSPIEDMDIEEGVSEKDTFTNDDDTSTSSNPNTDTIDPFNYPYQPQHDDLSCIPELPCSNSYSKVGKLYKCHSDAGLCGGEAMYIGACWPMMLLTQALIWGITLFVVYLYGSNVHWLFLVGGIINMLITAYALAKTSCSDPGIIKRQEEAPDSSWSWSERGQTYYPPGRGIVYCSESQVLVHDYDHFCPWTGTTIAGGNIKWFTLFVSSLSVLCVIVIFITILGSAGIAVNQMRNN
jgi:hypothetical protein